MNLLCATLLEFQPRRWNVVDTERLELGGVGQGNWIFWTLGESFGEL